MDWHTTIPKPVGKCTMAVGGEMVIWFTKKDGGVVKGGGGGGGCCGGGGGN